MNKPSIVLIDADSLLYQAAYAGTVENVAYSAEDEAQDVVNPEAVRDVVDEKIELWRTAAEGDGPGLGVRFFLSDRANVTFRHLIYDDYKANRKKPRPAMFYTAAQHLLDTYGEQCVVMPGLEADDALSIWARDMIDEGEAPAIVSIDKDMRQIPGYHVEPKESLETSQRFVIPAAAAAHALWAQVLQGDSSDNYKGAPGIGKAGVAKVLEGTFGKPHAVYYSRVRDAYNEQFTIPRWREKFVTDRPDTELILNYRLARLLRPGDYYVAAAQQNALVKLHVPVPGGTATDLAVPIRMNTQEDDNGRGDNDLPASAGAGDGARPVETDGDGEGVLPAGPAS